MFTVRLSKPSGSIELNTRSALQALEFASAPSTEWISGVAVFSNFARITMSELIAFDIAEKITAAEAAPF